VRSVINWSTACHSKANYTIISR